MDILMIPQFSYWACAWAGFVSYAVSMVLSYISGQKYYPINYPIKDIMVYFVVAALLFVGISLANAQLPTFAALAINTLLIVAFIVFIVKRDFPLSSLPVIGKKFRKE